MTLYHGSNVDVVAPDLRHLRPNVDFGKGFYTTPLYEQAVNWVRKFKNFTNLIDKKEALKRLKYEKPNWQVCFRTEKSLNYLRYIGSERL